MGACLCVLAGLEGETVKKQTMRRAATQKSLSEMIQEELLLFVRLLKIVLCAEVALLVQFSSVVDIAADCQFTLWMSLVDSNISFEHSDIAHN